mmetsp:Transcript_12726/g.28090  ORF Transcript_12726/g.28090 Transcript_12726/m.28090 type:complete len:265 (+) Transcript_12726:1175-1969(+)
MQSASFWGDIAAPPGLHTEKIWPLLFATTVTKEEIRASSSFNGSTRNCPSKIPTVSGTGKVRSTSGRVADSALIATEPSSSDTTISSGIFVSDSAATAATNAASARFPPQSSTRTSTRTFHALRPASIHRPAGSMAPDARIVRPTKLPTDGTSMSPPLSATPATATHVGPSERFISTSPSCGAEAEGRPTSRVDAARIFVVPERTRADPAVSLKIPLTIVVGLYSCRVLPSVRALTFNCSRRKSLGWISRSFNISSMLVHLLDN